MHEHIVRATINSGTVEGFTRDGVHRWRSIPYAQPPVGPLRPEPQRAHRRLGRTEWTATGASVAGEYLDGPGLDGCADDVFVHRPTVSNELAAPRLAGNRLSAR